MVQQLDLFINDAILMEAICSSILGNCCKKSLPLQVEVLLIFFCLLPRCPD